MIPKVMLSPSATSSSTLLMLRLLKICIAVVVRVTWLCLPVRLQRGRREPLDGAPERPRPDRSNLSRLYRRALRVTRGPITPGSITSSSGEISSG